MDNKNFEITKASVSDMAAVTNITQTTIRAVYPKYYPQGAVDFFSAHHSDDKISADILSGSVYLLKYEGRVAVRVKGGTAKATDGKIVVSGADEATLYVAIATNYRSYRDLSGNPSERCRAALDKAFGSSGGGGGA